MRLYAYVKQLPARIVHGLENNKIPVTNYFVTFIAAVFLRYFLKAYSQSDNYLDLSSSLLAADIIHFALSDVMLATIVVLLIRLVLMVPVATAARVVLPGFILLVITPLVDLTFALGKGISIKSMLPNENVNLLQSYLTDGSGLSGMPLGMKIEILIALLGGYVYARIKNASVLRSVAFVWLVYTLLFLCSTAANLMAWLLGFLGDTYAFSSWLMIHFYLIANFILLLLTMYFADKKTMCALMQDIRLSRILFYELMLLLGVILAVTSSSLTMAKQAHYAAESAINILLALICVFFAGIFSIVTNNIADLEIDKITNKQRPLVSGAIELLQYQRIGYVFLALSLFYAAMINASSFLLLAVTLASYYLYSMPPLRSKRVTVLSKLTISLSAMALTLLGYKLAKGTITNFPRILIGIYLLGYTLAANIIDIKDIPGDRQAGIITLPIWLGERRARLLIGLAFLLTYVAFYGLINRSYALYLFISAGVLQFYLVNRNPYREWPVMVFNNVCIVALILLLLVTKA